MTGSSKADFLERVLSQYQNAERLAATMTQVYSRALQKKLNEVRLAKADLQAMLVPFLLCNGACVSLAYVCYKLTYDGLFFGFIGAYLGLCFRALAVVAYLTFVQMRANNGKNRIHAVNNSEEEPLVPQLLQFFKLALFEAAVILSALKCDSLIIADSPHNFFMQWILFIPKSFFWEITFDFFHYWTHRMAHMNKKLYMLLHYDHHLNEKPGPLSTFIMTNADFVLTNIIPAALAFTLLGLQFTVFQLHLLMTYKTTVEIGGHSGIDDDNWHSFMQFPILPRLFPELLMATAVDHDLHHSRKTINFAKRFRLWDVVFGTYDSREAVLQKRLSGRVEVRLSLLGLERGQCFDEIQTTRRKSSSAVQSKMKSEGKSDSSAHKRSLSDSNVFEENRPIVVSPVGEQRGPRGFGLSRQNSLPSFKGLTHTESTDEESRYITEKFGIRDEVPPLVVFQ